MTLRKPVGSGGRSPGYTPFPPNPTSTTDSATVAESSESSIARSSDHDILEAKSFVKSTKLADADTAATSKLPPVSHSGSRQLGTDVRPEPHGLPLSLPDPQALATLQTSSEGWKSEVSPPPETHYITGSNEEFSGSMKSNMNNPFWRSVERISPPQADLSTEASSADIWAGEANGDRVHPQAGMSNSGEIFDPLKFLAQVC